MTRGVGERRSPQRRVVSQERLLDRAPDAGSRTTNAHTTQENLLPAEYRRRVGLGVLRALLATAVLVALYYVLPLDRSKNVALVLAVGLVILIAVALAQLRLITRARHPTIRAIEALATTVPLFLLLFASAYLTMANSHASNFSRGTLSRTDTLYFTVTVFTTVGFGDVTAVSQNARLIVTAQMVLDFIALGAIARVFVAAVQFGRHRAEAGSASTPSKPIGDAAEGTAPGG